MKETKTRVQKYASKNNIEETNIKPIKKEDVPKEKKEHPKLKKFLIISCILIILFIIYITQISTKIIDVKEYKIESTLLPNSFHGIKIVHISDIHYGTTINKKQLDNIVTKINELKPDIVVFTGDLIDENITTTKTIKEELITSLKNIKCNLNKYAIYGDEDLTNKYYEEIITSSNFILLENTSTLQYYKDNTPIVISGINPIETTPTYTVINDSIDEIETSTYYKLVLVHEPDSISKFINYKPDLVLSGHTLGGLIKMPFLKPLLLPKGTIYYEDYYKVNNTDLYISNGLGTSKLNARFNNHPSINFYRLYKTNKSTN